jgi:GLPGLI family protein
VKRKYFDFNWVLKEENKNILGYNAKKAVGKYFDPVLKKEIEVQVWFIPSIPLQSGPDIFMGLPGLIAEVDLPRAVVKAKKIETNDALNIKKVDDSEAMSQEEFEEVIGNLNKRFEDVLSH